MRITSSSPTLLAGVAAALILVGCDQRSNAPTEPAVSTEPTVQPQTSTTSRRYDLSQVPKKFFAEPAARVPRGYGASPALTPSELQTLAASSIVVNGSFERNGGVGSNEFAGWKVVNFSDNPGSWFVQADAASPLNGFIAFTPPAGEFAAMTDQFGPGTHILYQDVRVPAGQSTLSFRLSLFNQAVDYFTLNTLSFDTKNPNQQFRMDIMARLAKIDGVGSGVLRNVYQTKPGDPPLQGYTTIRTSLTQFAGRTVRLRFAAVDNVGFFQVGIDQVRISVE